MSILDIKPNASIIEWLLRIRCPQVKEPDYTSQPQALTMLINASHLTREEVAFKLGISVPMLDKASAGTYGGVLHMDALEKAMELAKHCGLPKMAAHLRILRTEATKRVKRGPKPDTANRWWKDMDMKKRT